MPKFFDTLRYLLPTGRAWMTVTEKQLRQFIDGLATSRDTAKDFATDIYFDFFPQQTRELEEWEYQLGIEPLGTEQDRRDAVEAELQIKGGQDPDYIQTTLRNADFDVTLYEWWVSASPYVARDPRDYTEQPLTGTVQCSALASQPQCSALASQPQCNAFLANEPGYFDNRNLTNTAPPAIPSDSTKWPYFLYIAGDTIDTPVSIDADSRNRFERLIQRVKPAQQWIVTNVAYVSPLPTTVYLATSGEIRVDADGSIYVWVDDLPDYIRENLIVLDAQVGVTNSGFDRCGKWANQGLGGATYDVSQADDAKRPTITVRSDMSGRTALRFGGAQYLGNAAIGSEMKFLHDGSPATWYVVYRLASPASNEVLFSTRTATANDVGVISYVTVAGAPSYKIGNGVTQAGFFGNAATSGNKLISSVQDASAVTELELWQDFVSTAAQSHIASPSTSDSDGLFVGANSDETEPLDSEIVAIIIDDSAHTDATRERIEDWLQRRYATDEHEGMLTQLIALDAAKDVDTDLDGKVTKWRNRGTGGATYDAAPTAVGKRPGRTAVDALAHQRPTITFDGVSQLLELGTAANIKFLHDGTGCTVYVAAYSRDLAANNYLLSSQFNNSGEGYNAILRSDNTLESTALIDLVLPYFFVTTNGGSVTDDELVILAWRFRDGIGSPEAELYESGATAVDSDDTPVAPTGANAADALHIGATTSEVNLLNGAIAYIAIDNNYHSNATIAENLEWLRRQFNITA